MDHSKEPHYYKLLTEPLKFRQMTGKYMRPGEDNYNRLYYPMAERPLYSFMRYNPLHLLWFVLYSGMWLNANWAKMTRRSRYYLHMFGFKRRNTKNIDYRIRFNQNRRPVRRKRNLLAKLFMGYTNRALIFAFFIPWQWALCASIALGYFHRNTRRRRERRIQQRLLFAPRRMVMGEQFTVGSFLRLWRIPRRFFQKVYYDRRFKHPLGVLRRRIAMVSVGLFFMVTLRSVASSANPTNMQHETRKGVPANVRRFLRDYTHPFQHTEFHLSPVWQVVNPNMWQNYQYRRLKYGQPILTTLTEWKSHNVMNNYNE
jgi:hypothetical protein